MSVWDGVAAVAGSVAASAAAWQLWRLRLDSLDTRAAEIESVSLATIVKVKPRGVEATGGYADWFYEFTIHNPGRLPISDVNVTVMFPCEVRRRHSNGTLDPPTSTLTFAAPLVPPHGSHPRRRRLSVAVADWDRLRDTTVRLTFNTLDAGPCVKEWPSTRFKSSRALRRRLGSTAESI